MEAIIDLQRPPLPLISKMVPAVGPHATCAWRLFRSQNRDVDEQLRQTLARCQSELPIMRPSTAALLHELTLRRQSGWPEESDEVTTLFWRRFLQPLPEYPYEQAPEYGNRGRRRKNKRPKRVQGKAQPPLDMAGLSSSDLEDDDEEEEDIIIQWPAYDEGVRAKNVHFGLNFALAPKRDRLRRYRPRNRGRSEILMKRSSTPYTGRLTGVPTALRTLRARLGDINPAWGA
jgi:hypothetical protein